MTEPQAYIPSVLIIVLIAAFLGLTFWGKVDSILQRNRPTDIVPLESSIPDNTSWYQSLTNWRTLIINAWWLPTSIAALVILSVFWKLHTLSIMDAVFCFSILVVVMTAIEILRGKCKHIGFLPAIVAVGFIVFSIASPESPAVAQETYSLLSLRSAVYIGTGVLFLISLVHFLYISATKTGDQVNLGGNVLLILSFCYIVFASIYSFSQGRISAFPELVLEFMTDMETGIPDEEIYQCEMLAPTVNGTTRVRVGPRQKCPDILMYTTKGMQYEYQQLCYRFESHKENVQFIQSTSVHTQLDTYLEWDPGAAYVAFQNPNKEVSIFISYYLESRKKKCQNSFHN